MWSLSVSRSVPCLVALVRRTITSDRVKKKTVLPVASMECVLFTDGDDGGRTRGSHSVSGGESQAKHDVLESKRRSSR